MSTYLLMLYVTVEQESAIKNLFHYRDWEYRKKVDNILLLDCEKTSDLSKKPQTTVLKNTEKERCEDSHFVQANVERESSPVQVNVEGVRSPVEVNVEGDSSQVQVNVEGDSSQVQVNVEEDSSQVQVNVEEDSSPVHVNVEGDSSPVTVNVEGDSSPVQVIVKRESSPVQLDEEQEEWLEIQVGMNNESSAEDSEEEKQIERESFLAQSSEGQGCLKIQMIKDQECEGPSLKSLDKVVSDMLRFTQSVFAPLSEPESDDQTPIEKPANSKGKHTRTLKESLKPRSRKEADQTPVERPVNSRGKDTRTLKKPLKLRSRKVAVDDKDMNRKTSRQSCQKKKSLTCKENDGKIVADAEVKSKDSSSNQAQESGDNPTEKQNTQAVVVDKSVFQLASETLPNMCGICESMFDTFEELNTHFKTHPEKRCYKCALCSRKFDHPSGIKLHWHTHILEKKFVCGVCGLAFKGPGDLRKHEPHHTSEEPKPCDICHQVFYGDLKLKKHMKQRHLAEDAGPKFVCYQCGRSFAHRDYLASHMSTHSDVRKHKCSYCEKAFKSRSALCHHLRTHVRTRTYNCSLCDKSFVYSYGLKRHMRSHTGIRPYVCNICGKAFMGSGCLRRHERTHEVIKQFVCSICGYKTSRRAQLKTHKRTHSRGEKMNIQMENCKVDDLSNLQIIENYNVVCSESVGIQEEVHTEDVDLMQAVEYILDQ